MEILRENDIPQLRFKALQGIGRIYERRSNYSEALDYYQQALAIQQHSQVVSLESTSKLLGDLGSVYTHLQQPQQALQHYEDALDIAQAISDDAGVVVLNMRIGDLYRSQQDYTLAYMQYEMARRIARQHNNWRGVGHALNSQGDILLEMATQKGKSLDSEMANQIISLYENAGSAFQQTDDQAGEGLSQFNIGWIYHLQQRFDLAIEYYQKSIPLLRTGRQLKTLLSVFNNIGKIHANQGQYKKALSAYLEALKISRLITDRTSEGIVLSNIGGVYQLQAQWDAALTYFKQSLDLARDSNDQPGIGLALYNMGTIYAEQGQFEKTLERLEDARKVFQAQNMQARQGTALNAIGTIYRDLGDYETALSYYEEALTVRRAAGDQYGQAVTLQNLSGIHLFQEELDRALDYIMMAREISQDFKDDRIEAYIHLLLGRVYMAQEKYDTALQELAHAYEISHNRNDRYGDAVILMATGDLYVLKDDAATALETYEQAISALEDVRARAGDDIGRAGFVARFITLYQKTTLLAYYQNQHEQAFLTSERGRARAFLDGIATGTVQVADDDAQALLEQEQAAYAAHQAAQDALIQARAAAPPDTARIADLEAHLADAEAELSAAREAIAARDEQLAALVPGRTRLPTLDEIQAQLDADTTLVAYFIIDDETTLAFVVTPTALHVEALPVGQASLNTQVRTLRAFDDPTGTAAEELYAALIAPLHDWLTTSHLIIVPHGVLHYLPFAALSDGERFLADDYTLTRLPAASLLPTLADPADVADQDEGTVLLLANQLGPPVVPGVAAAARTIGELYGVEPLLDEAATEAALREQASQARIVHLGAHGVFDTQRPLASHIQLAASDDTDGQLTVAEVYGLDLRQTDLVVLSACETQVNQLSNPDDPLAVTAGDDLVGLTRAFFVAGTPTVVATLWQVEDQPSRLLMERFYTYLREGVGKAEALRRAQLDVRADYPDPYHWAGFVLVGDGGAARPTIPLWAWVAGVPALLALVGVVIAAQRRRARKRAAYGIGPS